MRIAYPDGTRAWRALMALDTAEECNRQAASMGHETFLLPTGERARAVYVCHVEGFRPSW